MRSRIVVNRLQCESCGDIITSQYRHHYVTCKCQKVSADGGRDYLKRGYLEGAQYKELSLLTSFYWRDGKEILRAYQIDIPGIQFRNEWGDWVEGKVGQWAVETDDLAQNVMLMTDEDFTERCVLITPPGNG